MINTAIVKLLRESEEVTSKLKLGDMGIHQSRVPIDCPLPAVSYKLISNIPDTTLSRSETDKTARIQLNSVANLESDAVALSNAIEELLQDFSGEVIGFDISGIFLENQYPEDFLNTDATRIISDYLIKYSIRSNP